MRVLRALQAVIWICPHWGKKLNKFSSRVLNNIAFSFFTVLLYSAVYVNMEYSDRYYYIFSNLNMYIWFGIAIATGLIYRKNQEDTNPLNAFLYFACIGAWGIAEIAVVVFTGFMQDAQFGVYVLGWMIIAALTYVIATVIMKIKFFFANA